MATVLGPSYVSRTYLARISNASKHIRLVYVGYWSEQNAVVVAHQGTDPTELQVDVH